jgi:hypothetical protein
MAGGGTSSEFYRTPITRGLSQDWPAMRHRRVRPALWPFPAWTTIPTASNSHDIHDRGDKVARAKRTDKAEARRKYRAYLQAQAEAETATADETEDDGQAPARRSLFGMGARPATSTASAAAVPAPAARPRVAASAAAATPPAGQMNFFKAMGAAYKPVHYRDDLRYLPTLLTRTLGVWAGIALVVIGTAIYIADPNVDDFWVGIAALTLAPMPLVPVMLSGVMTQRAAWLAGTIAGAAGGIGSTVILMAQPDKIAKLIDTSQGERLAIGLQWVLVGASFGALFGALSAWYRRFLTLSMGPNRRQQSKRTARSSSRSNSRPAKRPTR